jgi:GNAT superfamily N-acetyltransferase
VPPPDGLIVRAIRDDDNLKTLSLGHADYAPLKQFLRRDACRFESCRVTRTHVLVDSADEERGSRVWGYVTLIATEVIADDAVRPQGNWPERWRIPAIRLARMAVDSELQGQDIGTQLIDWVIALINDHVARHVGCRLIVVDAKKRAVGFYEKRGFTLLDTPANRERDHPVMFLMLRNLDTAQPVGAAPPVA